MWWFEGEQNFVYIYPSLLQRITSINLWKKSNVQILFVDNHIGSKGERALSKVEKKTKCYIDSNCEKNNWKNE